jgi:subtilase family serine protease
MAKLLAVAVASLAVAAVSVSASAADTISVLEKTHQWLPGRTVRTCASIPGEARCMLAVPADPITGAISSGHRKPIPGAYTPGDLHSLYSIPWTTAASRHAVVGIVDAFSNPNARRELRVFDSEYGLPRPQLRIVNEFGGSKLPRRPPRALVTWDLEISLDLQTVHGMCPNCRMLLVEAKSQSPLDLATATRTAVKLGATVVSNSYGFPPGWRGLTRKAILGAYVDPGIPVLAAAGDSEDVSLGFPASLFSVVSVGGTSLFASKAKTYQGEVVWGDSSGNPQTPDGGTGSGCALPWLAPPWQTSLPVWPAVGCGQFRGENDVAAVADPRTGTSVFNVDVGKGWVVGGGTSLATPLIGSLYALAGTHTRWAATTLYAHLGSSSLHDVTRGSNGHVGDGICRAFLQCNAAPGYDLPTGVGTPDGLRAFRAR